MEGVGEGGDNGEVKNGKYEVQKDYSMSKRNLF